MRLTNWLLQHNSVSADISNICIDCFIGIYYGVLQYETR